MEDMRRSYERAGGGETGAFPILGPPSSPYLRAASVRDDTSSLRRIADTWWSTVFSETKRRSAICALRRPSATRASTSSSRAASGPPDSRGSPPRAAWQAALAEDTQPAGDDRCRRRRAHRLQLLEALAQRRRVLGSASASAAS